MQITTVRLDQVQPHPHNIRRDVGDVTELADSFKSSGMLQPLVVAPVLGSGKFKQKYTLIAGHRRLAAAKKCGWVEVEVVVRDDLNTEALQTEAMLIENLQRTNLSPIEEADAYEQLQAFEYSPERIAERAGRSVKTVKARLALRALSQPVAEKVHNGQISLADAEELAKFAAEPALMKKLEKTIGTSNFRYTIEEVQRDQKRKRTVEALKNKLAKKGFAVVPWPNDYNYGKSKGWERLENLFDVNAQPRDRGYADALVKAHYATGCEHGAAFLGTSHWDNTVYYVCRKPDTHPKPKKAKQSKPRETPEERKRRLEREQLKAELEIASATRVAFVKELIAGKAVDVAPMVKHIVSDEVERISSKDRFNVAFGLLGLEPGGDTDTMRATLSQLVAGLKTTSALVSTWLVLRASDYERTGWDGLLGDSYGFPRRRARDWTDLLCAYGYEVSDVEQRLLAEPSADADGDEHEELEPPDQPVAGVCKMCGCTEDEACEGGCAWMDRTETLCSACAENAERDVENVVPTGDLVDAL
ncbi:MAG TPA: ParB/RepB/Spo0J family partition protein [Acidothermaceae bacterium]|nr:ParB/RepB/Spo0J family partition protein [Acidothermaceae bacterium]